jgi:hypothetical protein
LTYLAAVVVPPPYYVDSLVFLRKKLSFIAFLNPPAAVEERVKSCFSSSPSSDSEVVLRSEVVDGVPLLIFL